MKSEFKFVSYKIDSLNLEVKRTLGALSKFDFYQDWGYSIAIRKPQFFTVANQYLAGIECTMTYPPTESNEEKLVELTATIGGLFEVEHGRLEKELEDKIIKFQTPTILMPYLRAAMSSLLASAGIGTIIFPLINLHKIAEDSITQEIIIHE